MGQLNTLAIVNHKKLVALPRTPDRDAHFLCSEIVCVLNDLDEPVEWLNVELLRPHLRTFEDFPKDAGSPLLQAFNFRKSVRERTRF
jgi:hypothetical protein